MSDQSENLWPDDLEVSGPKAPATILREQGSGLGRKTKNLVLGRVVAEQEDRPESRAGRTDDLTQLAAKAAARALIGRSPGPSFSYAFYLVAPALDNYHYKLFTMKHGMELYPVVVIWKHGPLRRRKAESEIQFLEILKQVFASEHTTHVIKSLLAQSQAPV